MNCGKDVGNKFCNVSCQDSYRSRVAFVKRVEDYEKHPSRCTLCMKVLPYERRRNVFCSVVCANRSRGKQKPKFVAVHREKIFDELGRYSQKAVIIREQNNKCNHCDNEFFWMGAPLDAENHHKDGDRKNDSRANQEALCPNCHSQTDNDKFKGRKHSESTRKKLVQRYLQRRQRG